MYIYREREIYTWIEKSQTRIFFTDSDIVCKTLFVIFLCNKHRIRLGKLISPASAAIFFDKIRIHENENSEKIRAGFWVVQISQNCHLGFFSKNGNGHEMAKDGS